MPKTRVQRPAERGGSPDGRNGKIADAKLPQWAQLVAREPLLAASEAAAVLAWWAHVDGLPVPADLFAAALDGATPPSEILAALRAGRLRAAAAPPAAR